MSQIQVIPLKNTKKDIKIFVKFAWKIYKDQPHWVPPLIAEQVNYIHQGPYHDTGVIQPFMAYKDGEPVGRIIAHYDNYHNEYFNEKRGCVGFFECVDDTEISRELFGAAEAWLAGQGMTRISGPLNFLVYDASGLLVDKFDDDSVLECVYNPPYYENLFLDYGFTKEVDWHSYRFGKDVVIPSYLYKVKDKVLNNNEGITFRNLIDKKKGKEIFREEVLKLREVFNKAWEGNQGHLPLSERQFQYFADAVKPILKTEGVFIAEHHGRVVGYILGVPDANQAIKKANGRLFPFGIFKMLYGFRKINRCILLMMGVLPEYHRGGLDIYFYLELLEIFKKSSYQELYTLIVESNTNVIKIATFWGAEKYKTLRHFSKPVAN